MQRFDLMNRIEHDYFISGNGDLDSSLIEQMMGIANRWNNDSLRVISYALMGDYYQGMEADFSTALQYYLMGIPLAQKLNDRFWLTELYAKAGANFLWVNNKAESFKYLQKALESLPDKTNPNYNFALRETYCSLGTYYYMGHKPDSVLHYFHTVNEINNTTKSLVYDTYADDMQGCAYMALKDTVLAETFLKRSIGEAIRNKQYIWVCGNKIDYVNLLFRLNRVSEAKEQALQCFVLSRQKHYLIWELPSAMQLQDIYEKLNNTDSAYYYSKIASAVKDSVFNQQKMNKMQALTFAEQVRVSEEQAKKAEEEEQRKENIQYALIAAGLVLSIILFLLLSRSIIANEKIIKVLGVLALLIVFEFVNLILHPVLEKYTHNSPFLMLLALVCIAALLIPLHHRLEKWATHRLVEKNKQIRLAAAKKTIEKLENNKAN